jgi:hypothetical protein
MLPRWLTPRVLMIVALALLLLNTAGLFFTVLFAELFK